ncbi:(deoxy)nucleoside triphosphate pyrophosphohydrolase [Carboxylicivirga sp. A043]|uniref:(deoxy)nucleoside triphosphate pyrophosphohydrolase n=1 Tax=Carboxylicivirga litoralis TaxID=2816963 RepID=UPI0021CAF926|nr:(deoxy)nucleoside triphosphate pyrophosphohydrolase [Carboxylicivirga sp. A043]MCU4158164.1 (deoxy)nucleoside triphosphate pyrophosphohydrolase [Carboxylicivirga sp. A043]
MSSTSNEVTQVTCAIIIEKGKILAALRNRQMSESWKWEFPGGKIDAGESAEDCIKREINEELAVSIVITERLASIIHVYPEKTIELIPFICTISKGTVCAVEHEKVSWFSPEELPALNWAGADKRIIQEVINKIEIKA